MYGSGATTPLVKKITQNGIGFEYTYDERGNIVSEKRGSMTTTYAYDALGQLIRVNDPHENKTWVYEYDLGGNIKSKKRYAYTTAATPTALESTINYTYGDSNWKDKLTAYNGVAITYDAIGNPLTDGTWAYTWEAGRQLKKMVDADKTIEFKYNAAGLRVQKKVTQGSTTTTTDYTLHGKMITHQKTTTVSGSSTTTSHMHFFYDNASRPAMVKYNGVLYTYVHNLQGDIVGIVDASGNLVVEYKYDAWGRKVSVSGSLSGGLGTLNPFRYRAYVYDEESSLYYLLSRYYNPEKYRFVNADNIVQYNTYEYCDSNPINQLDFEGNSSASYMREKAALHDLVALKVAFQVRGTVDRHDTFLINAGRNGGPGYPDIIVKSSNFVWEVKPDSNYGQRTGPTQMARYIRAGALPGYAVTIRPFTYTLDGKPGIVHVYNGMLPNEFGVVYYSFLESKKIPEPASVPISIPEKQTSKNIDQSAGMPVGNVLLLGLGLLACVLTPIPGDETAIAVGIINLCANAI